MKVLILGGGGMLGHKLVQLLSAQYSLFYTTRKPLSAEVQASFQGAKAFTEMDALDVEAFVRLIRAHSFDVVINCIGIVKQLKTSKDPILSIKINALFPHQIAKACEEKGIRFIHISTDCVFSGNKGCYVEEDAADAKDLYGRSKLLGEVEAPALTLRTSIIGHELHSHHSLIDWFLSQKQGVKGFTKAIYTGVPTVRLGQIIAVIIKEKPDLSGLYHVSSAPIDKCSLLRNVGTTYKHAIDIEPYADFQNDKSLLSDRFRADTGCEIPDWKELVSEMHQDYLKHRTLYI